MINKINFFPNNINPRKKPKQVKGMMNGKQISAPEKEGDVPPEAILAQMMFNEIAKGSAQVISNAIENMKALPPEAQFERERQAILNDPRLRELLDPSKITDMTRSANGTWTIVVDGKSMIEVDVITKPQQDGIVGPGDFDLDFQPIYYDKVKALPPEAQFERERQAILNDPRLREMLDPSSITDMIRNDNGTWIIVIKDTWAIEVDVIAKPQPEGFVGPGDFDLDFQRLYQ